MKYALTINQHNIKPHLDIERDIEKKKEGLFTFNLRVSQGNIEDYANYETVTGKHYEGVTIEVIEEFVVTRHFGAGSPQDAVRHNVSQYQTQGRESRPENA